MTPFRTVVLFVITIFAANASAQEMTALSCKDFRPTPEALERFPNLAGACEGIVDRDGELHAKFTVVVRRVTGRSVTLYLPATDHTFRVTPDPALRISSGGRQYRLRDLARGQELQIYLSVNELATPDIDEVAFVTETNVIVDFEVEEVAALPTTASIWPLVTGAGFVLLGVSFVLRRRRIRGEIQLALIVCAAFAAGSPPSEAQTTSVQKPGRVVTATIQSAAIVEAINKETRELKLLDATGHRFTIVADESVLNFDQIEPRDRIITEYLESVAIMAVPAGTPTMGSGAAVELAPLGGKPGVTGVETFVVKATVEALNVSDRIATLRYEDGSTRTIKIAGDVPLDLVEVGDEVRLRVTTAMAISVRKADKS